MCKLPIGIQSFEKLPFHSKYGILSVSPLKGEKEEVYYSVTKWKMAEMYRLEGWDNIVLSSAFDSLLNK